MYIALIYNPADSIKTPINTMLEEAGHQTKVYYEDLNSVDLDAKESFDLVVINLEKCTQADAAFCQTLIAKRALPILVLAEQKSELSTETILASGITSYGVGVFDQERTMTMIDVGIERFRQTQSLSEELMHSKLQLEQRKMIERAKGIIMTQRSLNEEEAYQYMRRTAMDQGKSLASLSEQIIEVFQLIK